MVEATSAGGTTRGPLWPVPTAPEGAEPRNRLAGVAQRRVEPRRWSGGCPATGGGDVRDGRLTRAQHVGGVGCALLLGGGVLQEEQCEVVAEKGPGGVPSDGFEHGVHGLGDLWSAQRRAQRER